MRLAPARAYITSIPRPRAHCSRSALWLDRIDYGRNGNIAGRISPARMFYDLSTALSPLPLLSETIMIFRQQLCGRLIDRLPGRYLDPS